VDPTTNGIRRRATAAVTSALAAATVLAALVVAAPPAGAAPRGSRPTPPARSCSAAAASPPWGHPRRRLGGPPQPQQPRPGVGAYLDDQGVVRSFVKDRRGRVTTFAVPGAAATLARGINDRGQVAGTWDDRPGTRTVIEPGTRHGLCGTAAA
jgi:hypothetical protein